MMKRNNYDWVDTNLKYLLITTANNLPKATELYDEIHSVDRLQDLDITITVIEEIEGIVGSDAVILMPQREW